VKFVLARPHKLVERCWLLHIDEQCLEFVEERQDRSLSSPGHTPMAMLAVANARLKLRLSIQQRVGWYMNRAGGCCPRAYDIVKTVYADDFPPKKIVLSDVKISQYPNGTHFYAVLPNSELLERCGSTKWHTFKACETAVKQWIENQ
jgi:hypothetical protein